MRFIKNTNLIGCLISSVLYIALFLVASIPFGVDRGMILSVITWGILILVCHALIRIFVGEKRYKTVVNDILIENYIGYLPFVASWDIAKKLINLIDYDGANEFLKRNTLICLNALDGIFKFSERHEILQYFRDGGWENHDETQDRYQLWQYIFSHNCFSNDYDTPLRIAYIVSVDYLLYLCTYSSNSLSQEQVVAFKYFCDKLYCSSFANNLDELYQADFRDKIEHRLLQICKDCNELKAKS